MLIQITQANPKKKAKTTNIHHRERSLIPPAVYGVALKSIRGVHLLNVIWKAAESYYEESVLISLTPTHSPLCNLEIKDVDCCIVVS